MAWSGLGVNYKGDQPTWAADAAYLQSVGVTAIRPNLNTVPSPWSAGAPNASGSTADKNAFWRSCAQYFVSQGFHVTWGVSNLGVTLTSSNWQDYHDAVVAEATYLQSIGLALGDFEIGNEMEFVIDGTTLTQVQLRANLRQLATDVKAVYTLAPISYACIVTTLADGRGSLSWANEGLGAIDILSIHPYGLVQTSQNFSYVNLNTLKSGGLAQQTINALGAAHCYISEFNVDGSGHGENLLLINDEQATTAMRQIYANIKAAGFTRAFIYEYVGYLNGDNQFAMKNTDGSFNPTWEVLLSDNHRLSTIPG